jgi:hypothetical protein
MRMAGVNVDDHRESSLGERSIDTRLLDAREFARVAGTSLDEVLEGLARGALFALERTHSGGQIEAGIPAFLASQMLAGAPMERIFAPFSDLPGDRPPRVNGPQAYQFLVAEHELLGRFTPIEILTGIAKIDPSDKVAGDFFAKSRSDRFEFVIRVAIATAARIRSQ